MYQYTVQEADRGRSIYLSGSEALQCARGQRVKVEVENFQHGTLAVAMQLLQAEAFKTAEGARIMVERLWCSVEHCPSSAVSFYREDFDGRPADARTTERGGEGEGEDTRTHKRTHTHTHTHTHT